MIKYGWQPNSVQILDQNFFLQAMHQNRLRKAAKKRGMDIYSSFD
jgi:hypothetical protein